MIMPASPRRQALGQHFLNSEKIIGNIVDLVMERIDTHKCQSLLEIGPGKGALTYPLIDRLEGKSDFPFAIVEKDRQFAEGWKAVRKVQIFHGDFLKIDLNGFNLPEPTLVVSNLPYSVSVPITERLTQWGKNKIPFMVLMYQAEVAQRIRATPGDRKRGSLSLFLQNHWKIEPLCSVPPSAFTPPPDVNSEVLYFERRPAPLIAGSLGQEEIWNSLLRLAFSQPRRMIRANFKSQVKWAAALDASGVDPTLRPAQISWEQWANLWDHYIKPN